jgi:heat shock protein HtpX
MYKQIQSNIWRTWVLMLIFVVFLGAVGFVFAYFYNSPGIIAVFGIIAVVQAFTSYYYSDKIALWTSGAQLASREKYLTLHRTVENLSIAAGLPKPEVYVIDDPSPNAFATGRDPNHASLAVTSGLLQIMDKPELEGVISHELSHIGNYDIRLMGVVVVLVGLVALLSNWLLRFGIWGNRDREGQSNPIFLIIALALWILVPISATLIQLAISRRREYLADATGSLVTRYPEGLASALEKIATNKAETRLNNRAVAHLFIADPYKEDEQRQRQSWLVTIFSTHPPIFERVKRLKAMIGN